MLNRERFEGRGIRLGAPEFESPKEIDIDISMLLGLTPKKSVGQTGVIRSTGEEKHDRERSA